MNTSILLYSSFLLHKSCYKEENLPEFGERIIAAAADIENALKGTRTD